MNVEIQLVLALLSIALDGPELLLRLPLDVAVFMGKLLLQEADGEERGGLDGGEAGDVGAAAVVNDQLLAGLMGLPAMSFTFDIVAV
jgi:hypothetical protein